MKEDILLTQLSQGLDKTVLGAYAPAFSIVFKILTISLSLCTFFSKQRKVYKKLYIYIYIKLVNLLDTIENS